MSFDFPDAISFDDYGNSIANNTPMWGGQSDPAIAPALDFSAVDANPSGYVPPYDSGGSVLDIAAFRADQAARAAAITGQPIQSAWLDSMRRAGMDVSKITSAGGAVYKLVTQINGSALPVPQNSQAVQAQAAAKSQKTVLYGVAAIAAAFLLS